MITHILQGSVFSYISPSLDTSEVRIPNVELTAEEYLDFATLDLIDGGSRGRVNSFGNSKRCIHLLVDELLWQYGLLPRNKKLSFPARLEMLGEFGILSARILRRLNIQRNIMEHDYVSPSIEATEDAVDVAGLLVLAAKTLRRRVVCEAVVGDASTGQHLLLSIDRKSGTMEFRELSAPPSMFTERDGTRYFSGLVRLPVANRAKGVEISRDCVRSVDLAVHKKEEWKPMLEALLAVQRHSESSKSPYVGYPLTEEIHREVLTWLEIGGK
ncbi:hypothetical protein ACQEU8_11600 [Streptomyces sp. CA-250714]|uniref:hypothetical protein n=1 Tax=Streptomyces sp. CA-250714 TaxID=3240060 RepID=UPI003D921A6A